MRRFLSATEVGISGVDLKVATNYPGEIILVPDDYLFRAIVNVTNVGGGANGLFKLVLEALNPAGTVEFKRDLATGMSSKASTTTADNFVVQWGGPVVAAVSASGGSLGNDANLFRLVHSIRLNLEVTEANNGTSASGSVLLATENRRGVPIST